MKEWLHHFFLIKTTERRAIIVLSTLILLLIVLYFFLPSFIKPTSNPITMQELASTKWNEASQTNNQETNSPDKTSTILNLKKFNPNTINAIQLQEMHIPSKLASTWQNYLSKGAKFYKAEDLKKLYGMNDLLYQQLEPYIDIPNQAIHTSTFNNVKEFPQTNVPYQNKTLSININTADTIQLKKLPMIGSKRAMMIIKYRTILGGFVKLDQLKEVYSFNDTIYNEIKSFLFIENGFKPNTIAINFKQENELAKHPYIRPYAKVIANYKKEHGPFESKEDLKKLYSIDQTAIDKILPYINFDLE